MLVEFSSLSLHSLPSFSSSFFRSLIVSNRPDLPANLTRQKNQRIAKNYRVPNSLPHAFSWDFFSSSLHAYDMLKLSRGISEQLDDANSRPFFKFNVRGDGVRERGGVECVCLRE